MTQYNKTFPIAGELRTAREQAAADAYFVGMPLSYKATPTATGPGTGNGTCTALSADRRVKIGNWTLDFSGALTADLIDPDGVTVKTFDLVDGGATVCEYNGLRFTITDGATAFGAASEFVIAVPAGSLQYDANNIEKVSWEERTLSSAGVLTVATEGSRIERKGLVNDSGATLTISDDVARRAEVNGILLD